MNRVKIQATQTPGETGELEEFTWDLFPVVPGNFTLHLDSNGLPKKGTKIVSGMIVIGKIAKTLAFDPRLRPTALEIQGEKFEALQEKYGHMWKNTSVYANKETEGIVGDAYFEKDGGVLKAVVEIER